MWKKFPNLLTALMIACVVTSPALGEESVDGLLVDAIAEQMEDTGHADEEQVESWARAGINYFHGRSDLISQDYEKAYENLVKAARHEHPEALYYLATMFYEGHHVSKDESLAEELYHTAAELGQPDAQMLVGVRHILEGYVQKPGSKNEQAEFKKAAEWMEPAAKAGIAEAEFWYGDMLMKGTGIPKDEEAGLAYLRKSAEKGNPNGQTMLGMYYWLGMGVKKDPVQAYKWVLLGQRGGNSNAGILLYKTVHPSSEQKEKGLALANAWQEAFQARRDEKADRPDMVDRLLNQKRP